MAVENISEGLKLAVSKGETLQQAMQSFYNAGYKKEDIESAAKLLTSNVSYPAPLQGSTIPQKQSILPQQTSFKPVQKVSGYGKPLPQQQSPSSPKPVQKVSDYEQPQKQRNPKMIMVILVIILLIIFGGAIGGILFFRENVIEFFNSLIG